MEEENRNFIEQLVKEKILGPGYAKDIFACDDDASNEILDRVPTSLYCTGILVPISSDNNNVDDGGDLNDDDATLDDEQVTDNDDNNDDVDNVIIEEEDDDNDDALESRRNDGQQNDRDRFTSDHIGVITCVSPETTAIRVNIEYAKYSPIANITEVNLNAGPYYDQIKSIVEEATANNDIIPLLDNRFNEYLRFNDDNNQIALAQPLGDNKSEVIRLLKGLNRGSAAVNLFSKLLKSTFYRRSSYQFTITIDNLQKEVVRQDIEGNNDLSYSFKSFEHNGKHYVKVHIQNRMQGPGYRFCIFQPVVKVTPVNGTLIPYTEPISSLDDEENNISEFIYRDVKNYGKGIACAANWDESGQWIETTYMPRRDVKKFSTKIENGEIAACTLRNISCWSDWNNNEIIDRLTAFVQGYDDWHRRETARTDDVDEKYNETVNIILLRQQQLLDRLHDNIEFLRENYEAMECFKIANTAMLLQMVISRDPHFAKDRDNVDEDAEIFNSLEYFTDRTYAQHIGEPAYYPFQLAFLLMNVKSTLLDEDDYRTKYVDLIWFPTGGGKTEAYLALTALTIVARRRDSGNFIANNERREDNLTKGVSVIMRYTLRLLTTQQFERASYLICSLEFLRRKTPDLGLGTVPITIGLWVGKSTSPNELVELDRRAKYRKFLQEETDKNPFPVSYCPWCGKILEPYSYSHEGNNASVICPNNSCPFSLEDSESLPIKFIDRVIYNDSPTLLFATVDKFVQLFENKTDGLLRDLNVKSPDLIIQDELHLISGPLGSTVSLFESIVEELSSRDGRRPKIIASTATTRNTGALVKSLYGKGREVNIFPAQGTSYTDNYFSKIETRSLRRHIGIMPSSKTTSNETEIRLTATLVLSRVKLAQKMLQEAKVDCSDYKAILEFLAIDKNKVELDKFWSIVLYFNSLKDLGRSKSRVRQEVAENAYRAQLTYFLIPPALSFLYQSFDRRVKEFSSRVQSSDIKGLLTKSQTKVIFEDSGNKDYPIKVKTTIDLIFASNMISVGIDINRWNLMVMVGQPRSTSEYIQSSSRVARTHKGLVYNLINPCRNREFSVFENYSSFHAAYYKYVEPLSATPLNGQMLNLRLWANMVGCYKKVFGYRGEDDNNSFIDSYIEMLRKRYDFDQDMEVVIRDRLSSVLRDHNSPNNKEVMSIRDIDPNCYIMINDLYY